MTILAVSGLEREARIAAQAGVLTVVGGGNGDRLREKLRARAAGARGIISIGIAGGLAPGLTPGIAIVASEVVAGAERFATHPAWRERMMARLPGAILGLVAGTDAIISNVETKAELHRLTGAAAADMESHIAARFAAERKIPFAVLRVIADPAQAALPPAALDALSWDGTVRASAVLRSVLRDPSQIPALMRTARESRAAFAELLRRVRALGDRFAAPDFG